MVQLPEKCFKDTVAFAQGYPTICEIGEERIRRAGAQIQNAAAAASGQPVPDIGFRVLRVDESCLKDEYATPEQYEQASLDLFADNSAEDALPLDLLFQVLPAFRIEYSAKIVEREIGGKACFDVNDGQLIACFDEDVDTVALESIAKERPPLRRLPRRMFLERCRRGKPRGALQNLQSRHHPQGDLIASGRHWVSGGPILLSA